MSVVVVTGAGGGLGASIAASLHEAGWTVGALDVDADAAERTAAALGDGAVALVADTTDPAQVERALDVLAERTEQRAPDAVVCNAGIVRFGPLVDLDLDAWRAAVDVNLTGTFVTAQAVARRMISAGHGGSVVTITSINGVAPGPGAGAYGATKAGVARLTQQMALEWATHGIRANAVAPGLIDAGMGAPIYADPAVRRQREERVPSGRLGTGDDVAGVVRFLLSDDAGYVNGVELVVDGGVTMSIIASLPRPAAVDGGEGAR